ncbi:4-dienoyl-CoA reductase [Striga asiatica]|uniref:4-dienoyl-CoA reductase n=1 Tax=Striga asiatica TaxID=4170 RepID=A0A5A7QD66_STRAF|nr:4-dienoyl-CoA reductase [Striga asiatica]
MGVECFTFQYIRSPPSPRLRPPARNLLRSRSVVKDRATVEGENREDGRQLICISILYKGKPLVRSGPSISGPKPIEPAVEGRRGPLLTEILPCSICTFLLCAQLEPHGARAGEMKAYTANVGRNPRRGVRKQVSKNFGRNEMHVDLRNKEKKTKGEPN